MVTEAGPKEIDALTKAVLGGLPDRESWQVLKIIFANLYAGGEINLLGEDGSIIKNIPGKYIPEPSAPAPEPYTEIAKTFYDEVSREARELKLSESPLCISVETGIGKAIKAFIDGFEDLLKPAATR